LPQHELRLATIAELQKTDLEWTRIHSGYFLDYYGIPHIESHMMPVVFGVDMANKAAAIPGTGNDTVSFTYTKDLAKFVVAALDLPKWDESLFCYGDKATWNELLSIAEEMRGQLIFVAALLVSAKSLTVSDNTQVQSSQWHMTVLRSLKEARSPSCPRTRRCTLSSPSNCFSNISANSDCMSRKVCSISRKIKP